MTVAKIRFAQTHQIVRLKFVRTDFPGGPGVKNLPANAGDLGLIPGPGGLT